MKRVVIILGILSVILLVYSIVFYRSAIEQKSQILKRMEQEEQLFKQSARESEYDLEVIHSQELFDQLDPDSWVIR